MSESRAARVHALCADAIRGREVVGRRTIVSSMWIDGSPAFIVCTKKTRRVLVYARTVFDAVTWFVDVDPARGVSLPRRKARDVGSEERDLEEERLRLEEMRARRYELIDAYYAHHRWLRGRIRSEFLRALASRR